MESSVIMGMPRKVAATFSCFVLSASFLLSCTNAEVEKMHAVDLRTIYFDYKVWGDEANEEVTLMLQYRFAGPQGRTLTMEELGKVEVDGVSVKVDSSRITGAFYEVRKPLAEFTGKHTIVFTDINKKEYKEEFNFAPMVLKTNISSTIQRDDLVFELDGLEPVDYVRVLLTDTSFYSDGINRVDTVYGGRILISREDLESLVNGPIHLEFHRENDRPVEKGTPRGGMLSITYRLKREFTLIHASDSAKRKIQ